MRRLAERLVLATFIAPLLILRAAIDSHHPSHGGERPKRTIFAAIGLLLGVGIITIGVLYYRNLARKSHAAIEQELVVIAQFKVDQLEHYRRARLADGRVFFHNPGFAALVRRVSQTPADADACSELQTWLGKYQSAYQYDRVFLLDSQGVARMAVPEAPEPVAAHIAQQAAAILRADRVVWQDFYRNEHNQDVSLAVMVPIFDESQPTRPPLGVLVLRIDPDVYLNPLIQHWPKSSPTAETLLVRQDGNDALYLNALRFRPDAALNLRASLQQLEIPAVQAVCGHSGYIQGLDYRGVPVLSAALAVPGSPWWLVTKVDTAEAEAPIHRQFWQVFGWVGILLFSVTGGAGMVWWQQLNRFHRERMKVAEKLNTSEARFLQLFATNVMPVAFWNMEGLLTQANDAWCQLIDVEPGQVRAGKVSWKTITPTEMQARDLAAIREIQTVGKCQPYEKDFIRPDGSRVPVLLMGGAMLAGSLTEGVAFALDLTESKNHDEAMRKAHDALTHANATLDEMVRKRTADLQEVVDELEHFSYALTHDLRAPLRAVRGFAQLLQEDESSSSLDGTAQGHLDHIMRATSRMDAMITDALQYSWALRGELPMKPVNMATLLQDLLVYYPNLQPPLAHIRLDGHFPRVLGHEAGLTQCFAHLLGNAVKFVAPGTLPRVRVWAESHDDMVRFWVEDNGMGIPMEYQERIWVMFQRLVKTHEGTGIGLAIVRKLVQRMGGRVGVESEPDAGSRFWIELKKI